MNNASAKELFILGRVSLRPAHGHEIMRTLRESRADLWVELSEKHVYYVLRKLDREGLISASEERTGNLPVRRVYTITDAGRVALAEMMTAENLIHTKAYSEFDVVLGMLCYTDTLDDAAKTRVLASRRAVLAVQLKELTSVAERQVPVGETEGFPGLILAKIIKNLADEVAWLESVMAEVDRAGWASMRPTFERTQRGTE